MKLTVFGASGRTGRQVVEQALAAGHEVTAFVRDPTKLAITHERLRVVRGDIAEAERVRAAMRGADAVVSALGQTKGSGKDVLTIAARRITAAMQAEGVARLVSLVGAGVPDELDTPTPGRRLMRGLMKLFARQVLEDAERHATLVRESGLEWTLVRPPRLTDGPRTGEYRAGYLRLGPAESISRADLAAFMLELAANGRYVHAAPMVSY